MANDSHIPSAVWRIDSRLPRRQSALQSISLKHGLMPTRNSETTWTQRGFRSWNRQRREAQPFRSEVDGFLPLSRHRSAVLRGEVKPHSNDVRERKMTLKFHSQTPSLLQDCTSLPAFSV